MTTVDLALSPPTIQCVNDLTSVCQQKGYEFTAAQIGLIASAITAMQKMEPCDRIKGDGDKGLYAFLASWLEILDKQGVQHHLLGWMQEAYVNGWGGGTGVNHETP